MRQKKTLGPLSANLILSLYETGNTIFTLKDVTRITGLKDTKAADLTSELVKRKIIARLKPGKYIIIPQELGQESDYIGNWYVAAREIVKSPEYYISHYSAMDIYNMLTHPVTKVYITTPIQEYKKIRIVGNTSFEFIYTNATNIWGVRSIWVTKSEKVRVSDIERTIVDCLNMPKYCGGILEVVKGIWMQRDTIDFRKFCEYVMKLDRIVVIKRAGYILESLALSDEAYLKKFRAKLNERYCTLDPLISTYKTYNNSWKLTANISQEEIRKAIGT